MRLAVWILLVAAVASSGCEQRDDSVGSSPLTSAQKQVIQDNVRRFVLDVAHDVSQEGPAAWRKHFVDSPSFFMADNGRLEIPNSQAATETIQALTHTIKHIGLRWGEDLRVNPLTRDFAVVATSYGEVLTDTKVNEVTANGFFTGIAENRNGQWQFRNAHWSEPLPPSKVR
jgi:hypothetical protein